MDVPSSCGMSTVMALPNSWVCASNSRQLKRSGCRCSAPGHTQSRDSGPDYCDPSCPSCLPRPVQCVAFRFMTVKSTGRQNLPDFACERLRSGIDAYLSMSLKERQIIHDQDGLRHQMPHARVACHSKEPARQGREFARMPEAGHSDTKLRLISQSAISSSKVRIPSALDRRDLVGFTGNGRETALPAS